MTALLDLLGGVRAAVFAGLLLVATVALGVQTWRLGNAQDRGTLLQQAVDGYAVAQATNLATIDTLKKANATWAETFGAHKARTDAALEAVAAERDELALWKDKNRAVRRKIYADDPVAATWGRARVPARVADRMRQ